SLIIGLPALRWLNGYFQSQQILRTAPTETAHLELALSRTEQLIYRGDLSGARELLTAADDDAHGAIAFALAETYDPNMLAAWGAQEGIRKCWERSVAIRQGAESRHFARPARPQCAKVKMSGRWRGGDHVDDGQPNDGSKLHCATKRLWAISWLAEDFNGAELQPQRAYGNRKLGARRKLHLEGCS